MKDLLISHVDLDGISPNVLMNLTKRKYEYKNIEIADVDKTFDESVENEAIVNAQNVDGASRLVIVP